MRNRRAFLVIAVCALATAPIAAQAAEPSPQPSPTAAAPPVQLVVAKAYITGASRAIIRTQPCEAGYAGT